MSWKNIAERQKKREESGSKGGKRGDGDIFMSTKGGGKFTVRFVSEAKEVNILWHPQQGGKKHIVPENYVEKMKALGFDVRTQIVSNIIDREDSKLRFKLLEKGPKVYGPIITRYNEVLDDDDKPVHPGGPGGEDWRIVVTVPSDPRNTDYQVSNLKATPFTKDELALIRRGKDPEKYKDLPTGEQGLIPIDKIYNAEKYVEKLDALIAEKEGEAGASEDVPTPPAADEPVEEDVSLDDLSGSLVGGDEEDTDDDIKDILF